MLNPNSKPVPVNLTSTIDQGKEGKTIPNDPAHDLQLAATYTNK